MYNQQSQTVSDIQWDKITCIDSGGNVIPGTGTTFVRGQPVVIGIKRIPFKLRQEIEDMLES